MPKYKAAIQVVDTWEVVFEAPEGLTEEQLGEIAESRCFDPDDPEFDEDKRWCRSDTEQEVVFIDKLED